MLIVSQFFPNTDPKGTQCRAPFRPLTTSKSSPPSAAPPETSPDAGSTDRLRGPEMLGNPYVLGEAFSKLDNALSDVISELDGEKHSSGAAPNANALRHKLAGWRDELQQIRSGERVSAGKQSLSGPIRSTMPRDEGGMFVD